MIAAVDIDWGALGQACYISALVGIGVAVVAALAVSSSLRAQDARSAGNGATATTMMGLVAVCIVALAASIVLGIHFMVDK